MQTTRNYFNVEIKGQYKRGCNKAHLSSWAHESFFGCPMIGTFNIKTDADISKFAPTLNSNGRRYWRLILDGKYEAWAFRWDGSEQKTTTWELVSKEPLPDELKHKTIDIEI